ncbi:MAG: FkbM family methyltransferase [Cyclobacteriaceae bacterium]
MKGIWKKLFRPKIEGGVNPKTNGENQILTETIRLWLDSGLNDKFYLFDIGANIGGYTEGAINAFNACKVNYEIHIFEPQASCFEILKEKFEGNKSVILNNFALGSVSEKGVIHKITEGSSSASIFKRNVFGDTVLTESIQIENGDAYLERRSIERVNFLKIDTEGNELKVLEGFKMALNMKIQNIQFEYGGTYEDANITLKEVFDLLKSNFRIGKIFPNHVKYSNYSESLEDFKYTNYFAKRKNAS